MKCSIVVLFKNRKRLSEICLESVLAHTDLTDCEIIGVDAGSEDGLDESLAHKPISSLISLTNERGVHDITRTPEYFRRGIEVARGDVIVKLDGDIFVWEDWLCPLLSLLDSKNIGVASYFLCQRGELKDILNSGLKGEEKEFRGQKYVSTDIINGGIWVLRRDFLENAGGYFVEKEWGGALDSCMSKKFLASGKELAYAVPRKATHCGGAFSTAHNVESGVVLSDSFYNDLMMTHYEREMHWFTNHNK